MIKGLLITFTLASSLLSATFSDALQRDITLTKPVKKIVAIGPGALRLVGYLQAEDMIVGIEKMEQKAIGFSEYRTVLGKNFINSQPVIGSGGPGKLPNLEKLIRIKPDLIIASFLGKKELSHITEKTGIPTFALSYGKGYGGELSKLKAIQKSLLSLGVVLQKHSRAENLVEFMKAQESQLKQLNIKKSTPVYVGGMGYKGAHGITSTEIHYPPLQLLGLSNPLTKEKEGTHLFVAKESLLKTNPPFIFLDLFGKKIIKEEMGQKKALYSMLGAYKNDQIHWLLPYNFYNTNVANVYINAWIIASKLGVHVDTKMKMQEIYSNFYGKKAETLIKTRYPLPKFK